MALRRRLHSPKSSAVAPEVKGPMAYSIVFVLFCLSWRQDVSMVSAQLILPTPRSEAPSGPSDSPTPVPTMVVPTMLPQIVSTTDTPTFSPGTRTPSRINLFPASTNAPSAIPPQPFTADPQSPMNPSPATTKTPSTARPQVSTTFLPAVPQPSVAPTPLSSVSSTSPPTAALPSTFLTTTPAPPAPTPVIQSLVPTLMAPTTSQQQPTGNSTRGPATTMPTSYPLVGIGAPTHLPSDSPSDTPSTVPTPAPTVVVTSTTAPTGVRGEIVVVLYKVPDLMSPNNIEEFENDLTQFYTDNLKNYSNWMATWSTQSKLTSRQRRLGESRHLQTNNSTTPLIKLVPLTTRAFITSDDDIEDIDALNDLLRETMNRNSTGFTLLLRSSETITNQVYFARIEKVEAITIEREENVTEMPSETSVPDDTLEPSSTLPPSSTESERMSAGAMAGTVLGIVVGIMACLTFFLWFIKKRSQHSNNNSIKLTSSAEVAAIGSTVAGGGDIEGGRVNEPSSTPAVQAAKTSGRKSEETDGETQLGSRSLLSMPDAKDDMSYAYSLDAGGTSLAGTRASAGSTGGLGENKGSLRTADFGSQEPDAASAKHFVTRQVVAPPGKLGLILDTIRGQGPVVHKINSSSPIKGSIFEGDVIIAINGIDTRHMNAEELTELMVKTSRAQRNLTIESEYYQFYTK